MSQILRHSIRGIVIANSMKIAVNPASRGLNPSVIPIRCVARWVKPVLREFRSRRDKYGIPEEWKQRSSFIEWNYKAELYAFGQRLHENFNQNLLAQAFIDRSYIEQEELRQREVQIENPVVDMKDNAELVVRGDEILTTYVTAFLQYYLPKFPAEGITAVRNYLLSEEQLAMIGKNLGTVDIILCDKYPPSQRLLANTLKAIIGARAETASSGDVSSLDAAYNFVRDFVCTHLNQLDVNEIWPQQDAYKILGTVAADQGIKNLEPRLIGEGSRNTMVVVYRIGIYDGDTKKLLGTGFGDSVSEGVEIAARNALAKFFGTSNLAPANYQLSPKECLEGSGESKTKRLKSQ